MTPELATDMLRRALTVSIELSAPILGVALIVGLVVAVLQSATQIQEATVNFVPKLVAIGATVLLLSGFLMERLVSFTGEFLNEMATISRGTP